MIQPDIFKKPETRNPIRSGKKSEKLDSEKVRPDSVIPENLKCASFFLQNPVRSG